LDAIADPQGVTIDREFTPSSTQLPVIQSPADHKKSGTWKIVDRDKWLNWRY
jgi:hypothetical protein